MKITLINNIYNRNVNSNRTSDNKLTPKYFSKPSYDSFQLSSRPQPSKNKSFTFTGITRILEQININSTQDVISQWEKLRFAPYYEALDDKIYPQNKDIRKMNFSFLDNVPHEFKKDFIGFFKEFTGFPNLQKVARRIQNEYVTQVYNAAGQTSAKLSQAKNVPVDIEVVAAGFDPSSSVGMERPFPGSDLDKAFVLIKNNSVLPDEEIINEFKGSLWFNTDQRILSLNNENTFPEVYTTNQVEHLLENLEQIANEKVNLSPEEKIKILIARTTETNPLKAGIFNIEVSKHLPANGISKDIAKNFAYFIESVRDGKILTEQAETFPKFKEKLLGYNFFNLSNVTQIGAKYTKPLKTKLVNREMLIDEFDKMPVDEQFALLKEVIKSVSNDHNNPSFNKYFKNDYDIGASYNRLNDILTED